MNSASLHLSGVHSFVEDKDLVSLVGSVFLVCLDDEIQHSVVSLKNSTLFF